MPSVSPADFARALAPALRQASSIASALEGRVANRPKAGEITPVKAALTIADTACQEAILVPLFEHFPEVRVEAEEDTPTARRFPANSDTLVVVDPIDGTLRFYLEGQGSYAVMIGLAYGGEYEAALVALPGERLFFSATRGGGACFAVGEAPSCPVRVEASGQRIFVSHDLPETARASLLARGFEPVSASGGGDRGGAPRSGCAGRPALGAREGRRREHPRAHRRPDRRGGRRPRALRNRRAVPPTSG